MPIHLFYNIWFLVQHSLYEQSGLHRHQLRIFIYYIFCKTITLVVIAKQNAIKKSDFVQKLLSCIIRKTTEKFKNVATLKT